MSAPVAFFAFNRPAHASRTLAALAQNPEASSTVLHVFIDGARNDTERAAVDQVRKIATEATGFLDVRIRCAPENYGLYKSITGGVSHVLSESDRVIVVEDDILVSPLFLKFMNAALDRYAEEPAVGSIHGYSPPVDDLPDFFFMRGGDCWGWATWADRWRLFDADANRLLHGLVSAKQIDEFASVSGIHGLRHLIRRARCQNQSWAAHWNASLFCHSRLTLHTGQSLVQNIGNDGSGTHSQASGHYETPMSNEYLSLPDMQIQHDAAAVALMQGFYDSTLKIPFFPRTFRRLYFLLLKSQAIVLARQYATALPGPVDTDQD